MDFQIDTLKFEDDFKRNFNPNWGKTCLTIENVEKAELTSICAQIDIKDNKTLWYTTAHLILQHSA